MTPTLPRPMHEPLPVETLRWRCPPEDYDFETTAELDPDVGIVAQDSAVESLRFGIECDAPGQNVFVRGLSGTGRMTLIQRLLAELMPACPLKHDRCYVHDFDQPQRPRLISLPPGMGRVFRRRVREIRDFVRDGLAEALNNDAIKARREAIERSAKERTEAIAAPFEEDLRAAGLQVVQRTSGQVVQTAVFPVVDGKPVPPEEFLKLHAEGKVTDEALEAWKEGSSTFGRRMLEVGAKVNAVRAETTEAIDRLVGTAAREILGGMTQGIRAKFHGEDVARFLRQLVDDVAERVTSPAADGEDPTTYYDVNLLMEHDERSECPIIAENTPTLANLLGTIEREWTPRGPLPGDFPLGPGRVAAARGRRLPDPRRARRPGRAGCLARADAHLAHRHAGDRAVRARQRLLAADRAARADPGSRACDPRRRRRDLPPARPRGRGLRPALQGARRLRHRDRARARQEGLRLHPGARRPRRGARRLPPDRRRRAGRARGPHRRPPRQADGPLRTRGGPRTRGLVPRAQAGGPGGDRRPRPHRGPAHEAPRRPPPRGASRRISPTARSTSPPAARSSDRSTGSR